MLRKKKISMIKNGRRYYKRWRKEAQGEEQSRVTGRCCCSFGGALAGHSCDVALSFLSHHSLQSSAMASQAFCHPPGPPAGLVKSPPTSLSAVEPGCAPALSSTGCIPNSLTCDHTVRSCCCLCSFAQASQRWSLQMEARKADGAITCLSSTCCSFASVTGAAAVF